MVVYHKSKDAMHYAARAMGAMTLRISELCFSFSPHPNISDHMGSEYVSREKKLSMVNFLIFVQKNVSTIRFQEIKIRPLKGFEKMRFLCFYIIGV